MLIVGLLIGPLSASAQAPPLNTALIARDIAQLEEQLQLLKQRRQLASELDRLMRQDRSIGVLEPGSPLAPRDGSWATPYVAYADVFSMQITSAVLTGDMSTKDAEFAGRVIGQEFANGRRWLHNQLVELALQEADLEQRIARMRQQSAPPSARNALSRDWTYQLTWTRRPAWSSTWRGGKMRLDTRKPGTLLGNIAWLTENPDLALSGNYAYPSSPGSPNQVFFNFDERTGNRLRFEGQFNNPEQMTGRFYEMRIVDTSRSLEYSAQELGSWVARAVPLPAVDGLEGRSMMVMMPASGGLKEAEACIDLTIQDGNITGSMAYISPSGSNTPMPVSGETGQMRVGAYQATFQFAPIGNASRNWTFIGRTTNFQFGGRAPEGEYYEGTTKRGNWHVRLYAAHECGWR